MRCEGTACGDTVSTAEDEFVFVLSSPHGESGQRGKVVCVTRPTLNIKRCDDGRPLK